MEAGTHRKAANLQESRSESLSKSGQPQASRVRASRIAAWDTLTAAEQALEEELLFARATSNDKAAEINNSRKLSNFLSQRLPDRSSIHSEAPDQSAGPPRPSLQVRHTTSSRVRGQRQEDRPHEPAASGGGLKNGKQTAQSSNQASAFSSQIGLQSRAILPHEFSAGSQLAQDTQEKVSGVGGEESSSGPREWVPQEYRSMPTPSGLAGDKLYRREVERRARNAERYAAMRAETEAALTQGCTFAPRINASSSPHRPREQLPSASVPQRLIPSVSSRSLQQQQTTPGIAGAAHTTRHLRSATPEPTPRQHTQLPTPHASHMQNRPMQRSLTGEPTPSSSTDAQQQSGLRSHRVTPEHAKSQQQGHAVTMERLSSQRRGLTVQRAESQLHGPQEEPTGQGEAQGRLPVGDRLYQDGLLLLRQRLDSSKLIAEAQAADWRRSSPTARPLSGAVYGREAQARVQALRARSPSPMHSNRFSGWQECTFRPQTNPRRPVTPQPLHASFSTAHTAPARLRSPAGAPQLCTACPSISGQYRAGSLAAALAQNAASLGLEVESGTMSMAAQLNFSEFLERQNRFSQARDMRLAQEQAERAARRHPPMSSGSRRILATRPDLKHFTPLHATTSKAMRKGHAEDGHADCTFSPTISAMGAAMPRRGPDELSTGDALRRKFTQEQLAAEKRKVDDQELTFKPQTLAYPGVGSRLEATQGSAWRFMQAQREQERVARLRAQEEQELQQCTFSPRTRAMPSYIQHMASCHASKNMRAAENDTQKLKSSASRYYSTGPLYTSRTVSVV